MGRATGQLDLFAPKPRSFDEAKLIARLKSATILPISPPCPGWSTPMSRAEVKRLMTPLPRITAYD